MAKVATTLQSSASNAAAATTNSSSLNNLMGQNVIITAQITNGATPPTVPCTAIVQISPDNATWYSTNWQGTADTTASKLWSFAWDIGNPMYCRVQFTGNTAQAVTIAAQAQQTV